MWEAIITTNITFHHDGRKENPDHTTSPRPGDRLGTPVLAVSCGYFDFLNIKSVVRCGGWERSVSEFVSSPSGEVQWRVTRRNNTGISEYWPSWMDHGTPNKAGGVVFRTCSLLSSPPDRLLVTPNFPIRTNYTVLLCYRPRPHASSSSSPASISSCQ